MAARTIAARYAGRCRCGASFSRGASIQYDGAVRAVVGCYACKPAHERADASDLAYEDQCAQACGLDSHDRQN